MTRHVVSDAGERRNLWYMLSNVAALWELAVPESGFPVSTGGHMPAPTNHLDSLIAAAKRDLDAARLDGNPTLIAQAMTRMNGRLDRKLATRSAPPTPTETTA